ncbi:MAG: DUF2127 domain-containing protein [Deltaproteobacteria bacterium]|nr:DUF2127 domain-containing protein [Deltaproteobacteria bacterium]
MGHPGHSAFLKFIIFYKTAMGLTELVISVGLFHLFGRDLEVAFTGFARSLKFDTENRLVGAAIKQAGMIGNNTLIGITIILFAFGVLNLIEAWGLHRRQRWGEWLTVIATSLLIPIEIYEITISVTVFKVFLLVMNVIIVYYLAKHKELFKKKRHRRAHHGV